MIGRLNTVLRFSLLTLLFCSLGFSSVAQDTIVMSSGTEIIVRVLKITSTEVEYKMWPYMDTPVRTLPLWAVSRIKGASDKVQQQASTTRETRTRDYQFKTIESHKGYLYMGNLQLDDRQLCNMLTDVQMETYNSAQSQYSGGTFLATVGWISLFGALGCAFYSGYNNSNEALLAAYVIAAVADIMIPVGYILKGVGSGRMGWVADSYNNMGREYSSNVDFELSPLVMSLPTSAESRTVTPGVELTLRF